MYASAASVCGGNVESLRGAEGDGGLEGLGEATGSLSVGAWVKVEADGTGTQVAAAAEDDADDVNKDVLGVSAAEGPEASAVGKLNLMQVLPRCFIGGLHWQRPNRLGIRKSQCVSLSQSRQWASL